MTGDEFTARYRLRAQLNDGEVVSYRAADGKGGYALVHVFRGQDVPEFDEETLGPRGKEELREVLEVEGIRVVVTEVVDPFSTFEAWYEDRQRGPEAEEHGAFTRIFRIQPEPDDEAEAAPPESPPEAEVAGPEPAPGAVRPDPGPPPPPPRRRPRTRPASSRASSVPSGGR